MKETEFMLTSDKQNWMDGSVISDIPAKITIIDPTSYVIRMTEVFKMLPCIQDSNFTKPALTHLCRTIVLTIMNQIVNARRAWVDGHDAEANFIVAQFREMIGADLEANLREDLRYELNDESNTTAAKSFDELLKTIIEVVVKNMNPNQFTIHRITQSRDLRSVWLEEHADWRVVQWTMAEQDKIASRHEDI